MNKPFAALSTLGAVLLLVSCGTDDAQIAAKNLRSEIVANATVASATEVTEEEADCVADGMVEAIGVDRLREYDILTEDLRVDQGIENVRMSSADADVLADVFLDCLDVEALFEKQVAAGSTAAALTADQQECMADAVTDDVVKEILAAGFQGEENGAYAALQDQMRECALREQ